MDLSCALLPKARICPDFDSVKRIEIVGDREMCKGMGNGMFWCKAESSESSSSR